MDAEAGERLSEGGWMDGWMIWMDGWMMGGCVDKWMENGRMAGWVGGWIDG